MGTEALNMSDTLVIQKYNKGMAIEVRVRKWGNSLGIILPKEVASAKELKENDKVLVEIQKPGNARKLFGCISSKMTGQQFKDMVREGSM